MRHDVRYLLAWAALWTGISAAFWALGMWFFTYIPHNLRIEDYYNIPLSDILISNAGAGIAFCLADVAALAAFGFLVDLLFCSESELWKGKVTK